MATVRKIRTAQHGYKLNVWLAFIAILAYLNYHAQILRSGGDYMTQQQASDLQQQQQQQNIKEKNAKELKQDIKNAEFIAQIDQPNHPNT